MIKIKDSNKELFDKTFDLLACIHISKTLGDISEEDYRHGLEHVEQLSEELSQKIKRSSLFVKP